jgi:hypothetical protein
MRWMDLFLLIVFSFPTVIFTVALLVSLAFWLFAVLGLFELDVLNLAAADGVEMDAGHLPGFMMKLGFDGLPITLILSGMAFFGWIASYAGSILLVALEPGPLRWMFGGAVAIAALLLSIPLTGLALQPLRGLFQRVEAASANSLLARSAIVRSAEVTEQHGTATLEDGGAGLILQVRASPGQFQRGDSVVLVEYIEAQNAFRVIAAEQTAA